MSDRLHLKNKECWDRFNVERLRYILLRFGVHLRSFGSSVLLVTMLSETKTNLQHEQLRELFRKFEDDLVHLRAWCGPWCPEVDERDSGQILGEQ